MKRAMFLTAYDRPQYLIDTLRSWRKVRGFHDWPLYIRIEPSHMQDDILNIVRELEHPNVHINVNPQVYGVLHHPWVAFEDLFDRYDFVVRLEDDLMVSEDTLEYFEWASSVYESHPRVAAVIGYTGENGPDNGVRLAPEFCPWVWGTWRDRWRKLIGPTWDHDYSTYNGHPGNQSGWDWNLNTRIFPEYGLCAVYPTSSRVQNIGIYGVHGRPENFETSASFRLEREPVEYAEIRD